VRGRVGAEAHTRLQESNWELSEHQFDDDYDDGMEYDADAGGRRRPGQWAPVCPACICMCNCVIYKNPGTAADSIFVQQSGAKLESVTSKKAVEPMRGAAGPARGNS
jgi:hypothetical protein